jgi:hypothetical protein
VEDPGDHHFLGVARSFDQGPYLELMRQRLAGMRALGEGERLARRRQAS